MGRARKPGLRGDTLTSSSETHRVEKELGERLRSYRTDSGMEIAELAVRTRITSRHIAALEEGQFQLLPGPVFVKGLSGPSARNWGGTRGHFLRSWMQLLKKNLWKKRIPGREAKN